jgi:hypothetical protein
MGNQLPFTSYPAFASIYIDGELQDQTFVVIVDGISTVYELKEALLKKYPIFFRGYDASYLKVYPQNTSFPLPDDAVPLKQGVDIPVHSEDSPLIVIVSSPVRFSTPSQASQGNRSIALFSFYIS